MATKPYNFADSLTSTTWQLLLSVDRFGTIDVNRDDHFLFSNEIRIYSSLPSLAIFSFQPDNSQTELEQQYAFSSAFNTSAGNQVHLGLKIGEAPVIKVAEIELKNTGGNSVRDGLAMLTDLSLWFCGEATQLHVRLGSALGSGDSVVLCGCGTIELSTDADVVVYSPP